MSDPNAPHPAAPDGLTDGPDEELLDEADVPAVLEFLEQAGAGMPQPTVDEL